MKKKNCISCFLSFIDKIALKRKNTILSNLFNETYSGEFLKKIFAYNEKVAKHIQMRKRRNNVLEGYGYEREFIAKLDRESEDPFVKLMELPAPTMTTDKARDVFQNVLKRKVRKHNIHITGIYFRGLNCVVLEIPPVFPKIKPRYYQAYLLSGTSLAILVGEQKDWLVYLNFEEFATTPCYYLDRMVLNQGNSVYFLRYADGEHMLFKGVYDDDKKYYKESLLKTYTSPTNILEARSDVEQLKQ